MKTKLLVTGANGFVGQALLEKLNESNSYEIKVAVRNKNNLKLNCSEIVEVGDFEQKPNWDEAVKNIDVVIHLAGRAHVLKESRSNPEEIFESVNVTNTHNLCQSAIKYGVKRFIYISSIKVNGEQTGNKGLELEFTESSQPQPQDAYGISKKKAEETLLSFSKENKIETVILRPPLIIGKGVKGNFSKLIKLVEKNVPLPFKSINNKRSMIGVRNFADIIIKCINHPKATNEIFLTSDTPPVSIGELIKIIAHSLSQTPRLLSFPKNILKLGSIIVGKKAMFDRLCGSLVVDSSKVKEKLGWNPSYSLEEEIEQAVSWLQTQKQN